jgi:hypothetical protein
MYLWLDGNLVWANDTSNGVVVDTTDTSVSGTATSGLALTAAGATSGATAKTIDGAITLQAAAALTATGNNTVPAFTAAVDGVTPAPTGRQLYVAIEKAFDLLDNYPVQHVYIPGAYIDQPNVAFYVSSDAITAENNPATNTDALDWLRTTTDTYGVKVFHWASENKDSSGATLTPATFTSASDRLSKNYHEVSFAYQLARFCSKKSGVLGGCLGFIGCRGPANAKFDVASTRNWIGYLPTYDYSGKVTVPGKGLLGIPCLVGTTSGKMHQYCHDYANGYRAAGLFDTVTGELDGGAKLDVNSNQVDLGAYLHVAGDWGLLTTGYGAYFGNIAGPVCGRHAILDSRSSLTNKNLGRSVLQMYRPGLTQMDAQTFANINMLRFVAEDQSPVLLHGMTAATSYSDYTMLSRMDAKFVVMEQVYQVGQQFVGESTSDGMQLEALKTALHARFGELLKAKKIQWYDFTISFTDAGQRIGRATVKVKFMPPDELVQLDCTIGISKQ